MPDYSPNLGLPIPLGNENNNRAAMVNLIETIDEKVASRETAIDYVVASGTNTYVATVPGLSALVEGMSLKVKFTNASTAASSLNINTQGTIPIRKASGNSPSIKAGQILHLVFTGAVFQLLGEGGEYGTAEASQVLEGYTVGREDGVIEGTMPNRGAVVSTLNAGNSYTIPEGYHNGSGKVTANSLASQTTADATAANIVSGKTAWVNGQKITGTIPTPVDGVNAISYNPSDGQLFITPPRGYFDGVKSIKIVDADYIPANILRGKNLFGIIGTAPPIVPLVAGEFYERFNYGDVDGNTYYGDYVRLQQNVWTAIYKPIYVQGEGSVRYSFKIRCGHVDGAYVQIFKNGIPFGTRRNVYYTAAKFVEDIDIEVGDVLELKASSIGTSTLVDAFLYGIRITTASKPVIST